MKKWLATAAATAILLHASTSLPFSFSFLTDSAASTAANAPKEKTVSLKQIDRLKETISAIQKNYITDVNEDVLFDNAIRGMVTQLDPHSDFMSKQDLKDLETTVSGEFVGIGVELTTERGMLRVISPIEGTPAAKAGLKPGDLIVKVDDKFIQDMTVNEAIAQIKGKPGTSVTLTLVRKNNSQPLVITIPREVVHINSVKAKLLAPGYAYVRLAFFQGPVADELRSAIEKLKSESQGQLKGFVLDLRNNPGGLLDVSADVVDLFLNKNTTARYNHVIVYTKGRLQKADVKFYAHNHDIIPHVPMVVLINGGSASASEITAGALQDYKRAIIMGTRSFGKGSVQTVIPIGSNNALKLTTALYYTPSGREIQARGIEPDVLVPELSVDEKKVASLLDLDEANFNHYIENKTDAMDVKQARTSRDKDQQKTAVELAKSDYQLYEAYMMLKGMYASRQE